ncbi:LAS1-like protein [Elysia marginata]|uniref:LAS1-like protein n=1 Tax=Elysia marginata TaxID=1093978 RepID=A0AAV4IJX3_9GAST|nr:LAS1-like protein [Elysia marginata]
MKHVVPWKTRLDFLSVYRDLYSEDVKSQESAIGRIMAWKSRAGNKLSVAIESSASLMQVRVQHLQAERDGNLRKIEQQLCSNYSLALIRFVNHMTEKAQNKAVAQPVHLIAREFGIPEWIVRLRHDATHSALPCLDALASGTQWALDYLQQNFWELQKQNSHSKPLKSDRGTEETTASPAKDEKTPKTGEIRRAFYEFQKIRYQRTESGSENKAENDHSAVLSKLQKFMAQNKMRFVKCLLEDGILIATEEQLQAFGLQPDDLLEASPPAIPEQMALFWRPLLKRVSNAGMLPLLLHTAMFSVTSDQGLRNYQLVAWIAFILANTSSSESNRRGRRKRGRKQDCFMRTNQPVPTKTLLSACLQNLTTLTAPLLTYLIDVNNVGQDVYDKLREQLQVAPPTSLSHQTQETAATDDCDEPVDASSSTCDSDSDTMCTLQGSRCTDEEKNKNQAVNISTKIVENIKNITGGSGHLPWSVCTDAVDWSVIPFGILPDELPDAVGECLSDEDGDDGYIGNGDNETSQPSKQGRGRRRRERRGSMGNDDEDDDDDDEDDEESDDTEQHSDPKRSKLIVTDELLL